nr:DNA polymerase Y family protein [Erythrobacter sp. F6033]
MASDRLQREREVSLSPERPLAFVEKQKGAMRLVALNRAALECGLTLGSNLADARAVEPELIVYDHNPQADAELLDQIADECVRYTPMVAVEPPDGLALDITGSAHLSGGEMELQQDVRGWFASQQIATRLACASSAEAASALARFHRGEVADEMQAIRSLPVAALQLDPEADLGLRRAGLKMIGDVMDRPRKVIAARFGAASVYRLERLIGKSAKPLDTRRPQRSFTFHRRFAEPITSKTYSVSVLRELLDEANAELAGENLGGRAFEARFNRVDGAVQSLYIETGRSTRDSTAIARLFDERLDGLADPLDPGFGFDSVELAIVQTELLKSQQEDIEKEVRRDNTLAETLDILRVRLGRNRVLRFRPNDTHIPENTQIALPAIDAGHPFAWQSAELGEPPSRPLHLFDPPQRIAVIAEIPDGPPKRFRWRKKVRDVARHEGPERIASEWWKASEDPLGRTQLTRDYYRIEDTEGRRYWVFRHGLYGREADDPNWYLHGLFA